VLSASILYFSAIQAMRNDWRPAFVTFPKNKWKYIRTKNI